MPRKCIFIVYIVKERIFYSWIRNWICNFLLVKEDPDKNPDPKPKLGRKWDPEKIVSDPQHCYEHIYTVLLCRVR
jgi:hypothetical protein